MAETMDETAGDLPDSLFEAPPEAEQERMVEAILFASAEPVIKDMRDAIQSRLPAARRKIPEPYRDHFMIDVRDVTE